MIISAQKSLLHYENNSNQYLHHCQIFSLQSTHCSTVTIVLTNISTIVRYSPYSLPGSPPLPPQAGTVLTPSLSLPCQPGLLPPGLLMFPGLPSKNTRQCSPLSLVQL